MTANRQVALLINDFLYDKRGRIGDPCTYCGIVSDAYDHVPPLHYVSRLSSQEKHNIQLRKVPACHECNSALSGNIDQSLVVRRKFVRNYLRKKYKKFLNMPKWDEDDLSELADKLADHVRGASRHAEYIKSRLSFYGSWSTDQDH